MDIFVALVPDPLILARTAAVRRQLARPHCELWGDATDRLRTLVNTAMEVLAEHMDDCYDRPRFRGAMAIPGLANRRRAD